MNEYGFGWKHNWNYPSPGKKAKELPIEQKQSKIHETKKKLGKQRAAELKAKNQFNPYC